MEVPTGLRASTGGQTGDAMADEYVDLSRSYGHLHWFESALPLIVRSNPHTYLSIPEDGDPLGATWLSLALGGMENLLRRCGPRFRRVAVVGTGSGLDAVGLSHLLTPEAITASDLHPRALEAARWNIARYARRETRCTVLESDLFRRYPEDSRFDLVY